MATVNPRTRIKVYERDGYACRHCGWSVEPPADYDGRQALGITFLKPNGKYGVRILELDHVLPKSRGGRGCFANFQTLCNSCNVRKGARLETALVLPGRKGRD